MQVLNLAFQLITENKDTQNLYKTIQPKTLSPERRPNLQKTLSIFSSLKEGKKCARNKIKKEIQPLHETSPRVNLKSNESSPNFVHYYITNVQHGRSSKRYRYQCICSFSIINNNKKGITKSKWIHKAQPICVCMCVCLCLSSLYPEPRTPPPCSIQEAQMILSTTILLT